jgi:hypothetical protein
MGNDGGWGNVEFTWLLEFRIETNKEQGTRNKDRFAFGQKNAALKDLLA